MIHLVLDRQSTVVHLDVARGVVRAPTVQARMVSYAGERWGDVRLATFRAGAARVIRRDVESLQHHGAAGLVLDLRGDPGGLLSQAIAVSSLFLNGGLVVSLSGAHFVHEEFQATGSPVTSLPLVVLVNRYTASSAEIVAAALAERGRALVIGERTFGKGVVQAVDPLGNGAALILTRARYYTPTGRARARRRHAGAARGGRSEHASGRGAARRAAHSRKTRLVATVAPGPPGARNDRPGASGTSAGSPGASRSPS